MKQVKEEVNGNEKEIEIGFIKGKLRLYFEGDMKAHLVLSNKRFRNGYVVNLFPEYYVFRDSQGEDLLTYAETIDVKPYREKEGTK